VDSTMSLAWLKPELVVLSRHAEATIYGRAVRACRARPLIEDPRGSSLASHRASVDDPSHPDEDGNPPAHSAGHPFAASRARSERPMSRWMLESLQAAWDMIPGYHFPQGISELTDSRFGARLSSDYETTASRDYAERCARIIRTARKCRTAWLPRGFAS